MSLAEANLKHLVLHAKPATPENIKGYGYMIGGEDLSAGGNTGYYAKAVRTSKPAPFVSGQDASLSLAVINPRPMEVRWMEYHSKHTQSFIPLNGKPFVAVLGKPTCRRPDGSWDETASELPDLDTVEAFYFDGTAGLVIDIGTWHEFPFALARETNVVVVLTNETTADLKKQVDGEAYGGDLCKRDLQKRMNVLFQVQV